MFLLHYLPYHLPLRNRRRSNPPSSLQRMARRPKKWSRWKKSRRAPESRARKKPTKMRRWRRGGRLRKSSETRRSRRPRSNAWFRLTRPRKTEVPTMPPAPAPPASAQQIAVRISPNNGAAVDLHVAQRGGEIHVSVRTPDAALQSSLRQDLGTLANSLERAGYRAETFTPRGVAAAAPRQEAMPLPHSRGSGPDTPPGGRGGSGASSNPRQRQQGRGRGPKNWLEELENSK